MRRLGAVGVLLALLLAACGGGAETGASRERPPRSTAGGAATLPATTTTTLANSPEQLTAPQDPTSAVAQITLVERGIRGADRDPRRLAVLGWQQQKNYGALMAHPEWQAQVLAALPDDVREIARTNLDAGNALLAPDLGPPLQSLPDWTILTAKSPAVLMGFYREGETAFGIPWNYLAAIHFVETRMGRIHGNSTAGAQGPMQFIPSTWAAYGNGGDVNDDHDAILGAARYLAASGGPANMSRALFSYNPSSAYVTAITKYAEMIGADPRAYDGYHAWQVYVATATGEHFLPEGWTKT